MAQGSGIDNGTGSGIDNGTGSGTNNGTGSGIDNGTGSGIDNGTGSGIDNGTGSGIDNGAGSGIDNGTNNGTDSGTGSGTGSIPNPRKCTQIEMVNDNIKLGASYDKLHRKYKLHPTDPTKCVIDCNVYDKDGNLHLPMKLGPNNTCVFIDSSTTYDDLVAGKYGGSGENIKVPSKIKLPRFGFNTLYGSTGTAQWKDAVVVCPDSTTKTLIKGDKYVDGDQIKYRLPPTCDVIPIEMEDPAIHGNYSFIYEDISRPDVTENISWSSSAPDNNNAYEHVRQKCISFIKDIDRSSGGLISPDKVNSACVLHAGYGPLDSLKYNYAVMGKAYSESPAYPIIGAPKASTRDNINDRYFTISGNSAKRTLRTRMPGFVDGQTNRTHYRIFYQVLPNAFKHKYDMVNDGTYSTIALSNDFYKTTQSYPIIDSTE